MPKQNSTSPESLPERLKSACAGLNFVSETDSSVDPVFGEAARSTSSTDFLTAIGVPVSKPIGERNFEDLFSRLTSQKEWFTPTQRSNAKRFGALKRLLEFELTDLKIIRVGEIHVTIYVLGIDRKGKVAGVKMNAIET